MFLRVTLKNVVGFWKYIPGICCRCSLDKRFDGSWPTNASTFIISTILGLQKEILTLFIPNGYDVVPDPQKGWQVPAISSKTSIEILERINGIRISIFRSPYSLVETL